MRLEMAVGSGAMRDGSMVRTGLECGDIHTFALLLVVAGNVENSKALDGGKREKTGAATCCFLAVDACSDMKNLLDSFTCASVFHPSLHPDKEAT